ncbi:MAG: hypothetical protein AAGC47_13700 [Bacteroidota bacterium]
MENDKIIGSLNEISQKASRAVKQNVAIIDQMDPTYVNVRNIHLMVGQIQEDQDKINRRLARIEEMIQNLGRI